MKRLLKKSPHNSRVSLHETPAKKKSGELMLFVLYKLAPRERDYSLYK